MEMLLIGFQVKKILNFSPELGNDKKNSDYFYPNRKITFDVLEKYLYVGLYAIQKSMYYLKGELISADYYPCSYKNKFINENIFFNRKLANSDNSLKKCLPDEMVIELKAKIINKRFGDYKPGIEFPDYKNETNNNNNLVKKYFYFLDLDLNVDFDNIKSMCY